MFYSDDPLMDFELHERELEKRLERLPVCDVCNQPIDVIAHIFKGLTNS